MVAPTLRVRRDADGQGWLSEELVEELKPYTKAKEREIVVDLFAGGGGASLGIHWATGRHPDIAINHDREAILMHSINHPDTVHYLSDIRSIDPIAVVTGRRVGLLWASPDCKHFSKAKGGTPVEKAIRDLAWVVVTWAQTVRPRVICLENVEEFTSWGPLIKAWKVNKKTGAKEMVYHPDPRKKSQTFKQWVGALERCGYVVECREMRASSHGIPTTRKRLYLVARCDGKPIVFPQETHSKDGRDGLRPTSEFRVANCIDWTLPTRSIFGRKRPLAEATLARIAKGIDRYVLRNPSPFIVALTHHGADRVYDINQPVRTICASGSHQGLVTGHLMIQRNNSFGSNIDDPAPTSTAHANHLGLVAGHLEVMRQNASGNDLTEPAPTICAEGTHLSLVLAFLTNYYSAGESQSANNQLRTVTTRDSLGTITSHAAVEIDGQTFILHDIHMRMLAPRELYRAQGFPDSYIIDPILDGKPLSKTAQIRMCGNSVCPGMAEKLVRANFVEDSSVGVAA